MNSREFCTLQSTVLTAWPSAGRPGSPASHHCTLTPAVLLGSPEQQALPPRTPWAHPPGARALGSGTCSSSTSGARLPPGSSCDPRRHTGAWCCGHGSSGPVTRKARAPLWARPLGPGSGQPHRLELGQNVPGAGGKLKGQCSQEPGPAHPQGAFLLLVPGTGWAPHTLGLSQRQEDGRMGG